MSKRLAVSLIVILLVVNLGFIGFAYYKAKVSASEVVSSASTAVNSTSENKSLSNTLKLNLAKKEIPTADVVGQDLGGLIRPRGDIRSSYKQNTDGTFSAEYKTTTAANVILSYYKTQLAKNNWILQSSTLGKIVFIKASQIITITATTDSNGVTTYTVTL